MSHTLSQIAAAVAGVALLTTGFVVFAENHTKSLARSMAVSVSLAVLAAVLITAIRNYGS
jgi:CBS domain containing-hemolysin-like protein